MKRQFLLMVLAAMVVSMDLLPSALARKTHTAGALQQPARRVKLGDVRQFKTSFQKDQGKVRLVALVSPT